MMHPASARKPSPHRHRHRLTPLQTFQPLLSPLTQASLRQVFRRGGCNCGWFLEFEFANDGSGCGLEVFGSGREFRNGLGSGL